MRLRRAVTVLTALSAGVTAAALHHRRVVERRRFPHVAVPASATPAPAAAPPAPAPLPAPAPEPDRDAVVLAFVRPEKIQAPAEPVVEQPKPARCGDNGGRTKTGAPCAARAGAGGRCRHHPVAA